MSVSTTTHQRVRNKLQIRLKSIAVCSVATLSLLFVDLSYLQSAVDTNASDEIDSEAPDLPVTQSYFDDNGYRSQRYRAPLPDLVPGGTVVRADRVQAYIEQYNPVLIDVLSVTLRTEAIDFGISWLPEAPRENIPGSVWLPNVGRADLEPFMLKFFSDHLRELTGENKAHPILFYCIADCWMSWNAVKRAAEWGYSNVHWFPEGTDGWVASGGDLVAAEPESIIDYIKNADVE